MINNTAHRLHIEKNGDADFESITDTSYNHCRIKHGGLTAYRPSWVSEGVWVAILSELEKTNEKRMIEW